MKIGETRVGRRIYTDANGYLPPFAEGDYGQGLDGGWCARPPGAHLGDLRNHEVAEHEDGTITVTPSILITGEDEHRATRWHGHLERGVWRRIK